MFPLCLGGNVFGWTIDEERSFAVLDAYVAGGGNFIDTADIYGRRGPDGRAGTSERIIGRWMAARGNREKLVIATKVGMGEHPSGLSAQSIRAGIESSLERLGIETVDLYYAHRDDSRTPLQETLGAFAELIGEGRIRYAGVSNYSAERLEQALGVAHGEGVRLVALQPHYNLLERGDYEGELAAVCERHGLACMPYFGLAKGFLTGKYTREATAGAQSARAQGVRESYFNERGFAVLEALREIALAHGAPIAAVALAWLLAQQSVCAPIASATSAEQVAELLRSTELRLDTADLERLEALSG